MIVDLILDSEVPNDDPYPFGKHVPYIPATVGITEEGFWLVPVEPDERIERIKSEAYRRGWMAAMEQENVPEAGIGDNDGND